MSDQSNDALEKTILIVDDVEYTRQLLRNAVLAAIRADPDGFKIQRYKFVNASNSLDAMAKIENYQPDLIFLDIELPGGVNGIEILKRIKAQDPKSFVIMVSGESTIQNVQNSLKNGAAGFIVKPFSAIKVDEAMRNFEKKKLK